MRQRITRPFTRDEHGYHENPKKRTERNNFEGASDRRNSNGGFSDRRGFGDRPAGRGGFGKFSGSNGRPFDRKDSNDRRMTGRKFDKPTDRRGHEDTPSKRREFGSRPSERRGFGDRPAGRGGFGKFSGGNGRPFDNKESGDRRMTGRKFDKPTDRRGHEDTPSKRREFGNRPSDRRGFGNRPAGRGGFGKFSGSNGRPFDNKESDDRRMTGRRFDKPTDRREFGNKPAGHRNFGKPFDRRNAGKQAFEKDVEYDDVRISANSKSVQAVVKKDDGAVRLNKFIANAGLCSRREADEYIAAGLVSVNGEITTEMGIKVYPDKDEVRFNGEKIKGEKKVYIVLNKPKDYVTTMSDPHATKNVMQLISHDLCPERVFPVGRLDKATTGVLLLTNDGELAEKLTHPSFQKKKIYQVELDKNLKPGDMEKLTSGIQLEDGPAYADEVAYVDGEKSVIGIEIHSGRNRIVRRMFESLGYNVKKLDRVYFAGLTKKNIRRGQWRFLSDEEVTMLKLNFYD